MSPGRSLNQGRRADFQPYAASVFAPHLFSGLELRAKGCGATALALLTGISPAIVAAGHRGRHFSDSFMVRFLRRHGYRVLRVTPLSVCGSRSKIGDNHVLLISQLFRRYEATWGVIHGDAYYHNFDFYALSALAFVNKPILSAYLVIHPSWRIDDAPEPATAMLPRTAGPRIKLSDLRKHAEFSDIRTWA